MRILVLSKCRLKPTVEKSTNQNQKMAEEDERILRAHTMQRAAAQSTGVNLGSMQGGSAFTDQVNILIVYIVEWEIKVVSPPPT
jgi:hypothetical protein